MSTPVYTYQLKEREKDNPSIGLIYDEAPEEIRRADPDGTHTIDLYSMVSVLWKAVQEIKDEIETIKEYKSDL